MMKASLPPAPLRPGIPGLVAICVITLLLGLAWGIAGCGALSETPAAGPPAATAPESATTAPATDSGAPAAASASGAAPGVFDDRVLFGQSAAFSGPAAELGLGMKRGILAAFEEINRNGGIHGRTLQLVSRDDTYEPELAADNTAYLIEHEAVFALIGAVGTPTSRAATPVARDAAVPYIAPFTGAAFLRDHEKLPNVINMRASYNQETEEMVERFTTDRGIRRIAVMYQDDSFGRAGYNGALAALTRRDMEPVAVGLYPRNTTAVKTGVFDLRRGNPEGIILVGAYAPVADAILWAKEIGIDAEFITISFVGSNALAQRLGPEGAGVFVTQVVPFPTDQSSPAVVSYLRALADYDVATGTSTTPGFVSFEGYLAGRLAIAGLERCGRELTRACFMDAFNRTEAVNLEGFQLRYRNSDGSYDNQGSDTVFLTMIGADGAYQPIEKLPPK